MANATSVRLDPGVRDRLVAVAETDFGGMSASDAISRLLDEHWEMKAIAAMDHFRATDPQGWAAYLADADAASRVTPPLSDDPWDEAA